MADIIAQLIKVYMTEEWWHSERLSLEDSWKYFKCLLMKGNLIYREDDGMLVAYAEVYYITPKQLKKLSDDEPFPVLEENITDGDIAYVQNLWIKEGYRGNGMLRSMKRDVKSTLYFAGKEQKNNNRFRIWEN